MAMFPCGFPAFTLALLFSILYSAETIKYAKPLKPLCCFQEKGQNLSYGKQRLAQSGLANFFSSMQGPSPPTPIYSQVQFMFPVYSSRDCCFLPFLNYLYSSFKYSLRGGHAFQFGLHSTMFFFPS